MKLILKGEKNYHFPLGKVKETLVQKVTKKVIPNWYSYKPGDEVQKEHEAILRSKGAKFEGDKVELVEGNEGKVSSTEEELYKLKKKDQVALLKEFGLSSKEIKAFNSEKKRVEKLLELQEG